MKLKNFKNFKPKTMVENPATSGEEVR